MCTKFSVKVLKKFSVLSDKCQRTHFQTFTSEVFVNHVAMIQIMDPYDCTDN